MNFANNPIHAGFLCNSNFMMVHVCSASMHRHAHKHAGGLCGPWVGLNGIKDECNLQLHVWGVEKGKKNVAEKE